MANERFKVKFGLAVGDTSATIDAASGDITTAGNVAANGGQLNTTATNALVFNSNATTVNAFGAATTLNIGNVGGTTTVNGNLTVGVDVDVRGGDITNTTGALQITTGSNGNLTLDPNGTGEVIINAPLDVNGNITADLINIDNIQINGNDIISTNTDGNINIIPNGTGDVFLTTDAVYVGDLNATATISTNGTGNLVLNTNANVNSGSFTIANGTNGNLTLAPNGTGDLILTFNNGGNLINSRNYVLGAIRNATTEAAGDIWALNSTGTVQPFRGVSIDNSADTTKNSGYVARNYSNTAANRSRFIFERARGTAASPSAVQLGDFLGELDVTGYTSTGWLNDTVSVVPAFFGFTATENWVSNTNLGTGFALNLAPTATTITSAANLIPTIASSPQALVLRGDVFSIARGKTTAFTANNSSVNGTTLTIGTVTSGTVAVGQVIQSTTNSLLNATYIVANISGSGSGSTWTLSSSQTTQSGLLIAGNTGFIGSPSAATTVDALADLRLLTNNIKGSGGTTQVVTSSAGATLELRGNEIQLEDASGTAIKGGLINYRRTHGCFHKIANVTAAAANTVYDFDWYTDTTVHVGNQGVTVTAGNPTRVNIDTAGRYTAFVEMQVKNTVSANRVAWIWLAKNGTDLSETRIKVEIKQGGGTDAYQLINKLWLLENIAANDYIEVRFAVDNITGISLEYEAAQTTPFIMPAQPSATLTIVPVGA